MSDTPTDLTAALQQVISEYAIENANLRLRCAQLQAQVNGQGGQDGDAATGPDES